MTTPDQPPQYAPPSSDRGGGSSWFAQVSEWAGAAGAAANAPSGGYSFEPDQLNEIAHEWEALALAYKADLRQAGVLAQTEGPGAEYASGDNAQLVRQSGEALLSALQDRINYCRSQAEKFRRAAGQYVEAEASAGDEIQDQGGSL